MNLRQKKHLLTKLALISVYCLFDVMQLFAQYYTNQAAVFNGTSSYVSARSTVDNTPTSGITVEAWIFPTSLPASAAVIAKNYTTGYYFGIESSGRIVFLPKGSGFFLRSRVAGIVKINQWTHIAATFDGSTTRIFINGAQDTSTTSITGAVGQNTDSLKIGADKFGTSNSFFFQGMIDNARVWKSARTQTEIAAARFIPMNLPAANGMYASLGVSFQFDGEAVDYSGATEEYGQANNILYEDHSNKTLNYLDYNNCLSLNGTTDYARRGSYNLVYDPTSIITVEAWVRRDTVGTQPATQNIVNRSGGTNRYDYALFLLATGQVYFAINNGAHNISTSPLVTHGQWTHLAATYNQLGGVVNIYVNGELSASGTFSGSPGLNASNDSTFIGGIGATTYSPNKFKGQIDEVRIWHKSVRTQQQIKDYMHRHYIASTADSLMYIDFDTRQNSFHIGYYPFPGSLRLVGNAQITSAHNISDNRRSSPMLSDPFEGMSFVNFTRSDKRFYVPDANAQGVTDSIYIAGGPPVSGLNVLLLLSHTYTADLRISLTSPSGATVNLMAVKGGSGNDVMTIFSDLADSVSKVGESTVNGPGVNPPFSPSVKPDQSLSAFNGQPSAGWWKLKIVDQAGSDIGYVHSWGLNLVSLKTLKLSALIQGMYDPSVNLMKGDTVQVILRIPLPPYPAVDSSKGVIDSNGNATLFFSKVNNGYKVLRHRNSIDVWSSAPVPFTGDTLFMDFTSSASMAYGNNMVQVDSTPVRFALFSGDVNRDGIVDASDLSEIGNDAGGFLKGYVVSDLTGDNFVDGTDFMIADNNAVSFVSVISP